MSRKEKIKNFWSAVRNELHENKKTFVVYTGLRLLVIIMMLLQIFNHYYDQVFLCGLTLIFFVIPAVIEKKLNLPAEKRQN